MGSVQATSELFNEYSKENSKLGVAHDAKKSFSHMEKAANQGDKKSMDVLIEIYSEGVQNFPGIGNIPVDLAKAAKWQEAKKSSIDANSLEFLIQKLRELQN